ncbi:MAG TPA: hypothetical protein VNI02_10365, partial [Blastocatellia bacterium]|nr:hypothetical protein [Blastocatellia bacterium]
MHTLAPIARRNGQGRTFKTRCALLMSLLVIAYAIDTSTLKAQGAATRAETFSLNPGGQVRVENARG